MRMVGAQLVVAALATARLRRGACDVRNDNDAARRENGRYRIHSADLGIDLSFGK